MLYRALRKGMGFGMVLLAMGITGCGAAGGMSTDLSSSGGQGGTGITNVFSSPAELGVGDIMPILFEDGVASVDFDGVETSSRFIMVVGSANITGAPVSVQLSGDLSAPLGKYLESEDESDFAHGHEHGYDDADEYAVGDMFDAWLRAAESVLPEQESLPSFSSMKAMSSVKAVNVGDGESFRVLGSLSSVSSYVTVDAQARCVGQRVVIFVDTRVTSQQLTANDIQALCSEFDAGLPRQYALFGDPSDVDGDGKVHVLMTPQINRLGSMGGGIITGYFYAGDLFARSNSNPISNNREIVYTMVPDPSGAHGVAVSRDFALSNLLRPVFWHEMQHAISYNQHVFVNGGSAEQSWLNEGISHLAEDLMGYNVENYSRYGLFLSSPSQSGLVTSSSPNLLERGAAYLFLRYLFEQSDDGEAFVRRLVSSGHVGVRNVENAFAGEEGFSRFSEFFGRWTVALAVTDRGITSDAHYTYERPTINSSTGNPQGVCLICNPEDNRGTRLEGVYLSPYNGYHTVTVDGTAAKYYRIGKVPAQIDLSGSASSNLFGVLIRTE